MADHAFKLAIRPVNTSRNAPSVRARGEASLCVRQQLMSQLSCLIRDKGMKQVEAATWLSVDQSRISNLLNGKLSRFSTDTLLDMINRAGIGLTIAFTEARPPHEDGQA